MAARALLCHRFPLRVWHPARLAGMSDFDVVRDLIRRLAVLGGTSTLAGAALAASRREAVRAFGRQTAGWGVIDIGIAAVSALRPNPPGPDRLRRVLVVNSVLDVGYVAVGLHCWCAGRRSADGCRARRRPGTLPRSRCRASRCWCWTWSMRAGWVDARRGASEPSGEEACNSASGDCPAGHVWRLTAL